MNNIGNVTVRRLRIYYVLGYIYGNIRGDRVRSNERVDDSLDGASEKRSRE